MIPADFHDGSEGGRSEVEWWEGWESELGGGVWGSEVEGIEVREDCGVEAG